MKLNKVALVVGVSGMDGAAITQFLLDKNYIVLGTYRKNSCLDINKIKERYDSNRLYLEHCDITDFNSVKTVILSGLRQFGKIDEAYLLASQSHVGLSFETAETSILTNGMSVYNVLENLKDFSKTTKLYFAATSELLGGDPSKCPFDENSEYECRSPYSIGKELGTRLVKFYNQTYGMFATYGILFNHSNVDRHESFFIRRITKAAARIALGKQDGLLLGNLQFWRDEHYSEFGVEIMYKMLQLSSPEIFIICRGECFHGEQFLDEAFNFFNLDWKKYVKIDESRFRANEVVKLVGNPQKAIDILGWNPNRMSFKDHIGLMCKYDYELESGIIPIRPKVFELYP